MEILNCIKYKDVKFNFENSTIEYNGRIKKVVKDNTGEFIYKIQKTQIKARNGIQGLYEFMQKIALDKENFGYGWFADICKNI